MTHWQLQRGLPDDRSGTPSATLRVSCRLPGQEPLDPLYGVARQGDSAASATSVRLAPHLWLHTSSGLGPIGPAQVLAPGVYTVHLTQHATTIVALACAWDKVPDLSALVGPTPDVAPSPASPRPDAGEAATPARFDQPSVAGRRGLLGQAHDARHRTLVVSACGLYEGVWYDGPLAHILADGSIASYLPAGGAASLVIPAAPAPTLSGVPWAHVLRLEGDTAERTQRCLLAMTSAYLLSLPASQGRQIALGKLDLTMALALVLVRQATAEAPLSVTCTAPLPPAWRRLSQNLGVSWSLEQTSGEAQLLTPVAQAIGAAHTQALLTAVNLISDVVPKTLK